MRTSVLRLLAFLAFATAVIAWTKEDHEIFQLRDQVLAVEGQDATFYSFLGVPPSASADDVVKTYRKRSKQLHPDKAVPAILARKTQPKTSDKKGSKPSVHVTKGPTEKDRKQAIREAKEKYATLGSVRDILKGPSRERYDHFLANGFPRWRGTGYYYQRFRPGLLSVILGLLVVFGGGLHYAALYVSWKRHKEFVGRYVTHARKMAWGNESGMPGVPTVNTNGLGGATSPPPPQEEEPEAYMPLNRKQKRMQEKDSKKKDKAPKTVKARGISKPVDAVPLEGPQGSKKKVVAQNGKVLIVDSVGDVFLEETTAEGDTHEYLLDPDEIPMPTILQTALFRLPVWLYYQSVGRVLNKGEPTDPLLEDQLTFEGPDGHSKEALESATAMNPKQETKRRKAKSRAN